MRDNLILFLKTLEEEIPPPPLCHHVISYTQYGSDADGWVDKLALQVNYHGQFYCFFLDDADLAGPNIAVGTIRRSLAGVPSPNTQLGVGVGQYVAADGPVTAGDTQ